jgi:hypothetical protein
MRGIVDRLGDLSWLGDAYAGQGWVEVGEETAPVMTADEANKTVAKLLLDSAWAVAVDNTNMTKEARANWLDFREALRAVPTQAGFPSTIVWPSQPTT